MSTFFTIREAVEGFRYFRHDSQSQKVLFTDMLFIPSSIKPLWKEKNSRMPTLAALLEVSISSLKRLEKHH